MRNPSLAYHPVAIKNHKKSHMDVGNVIHAV